MTISDAKKIFLSHRSADKAKVVDFKKTLELLGYEPWLDEDAMPAGTSLERGLLQGMKESCGVVFFITPSFRDEGYLQTEIDYAVQEKRKKEDKFAIITLLFDSDDDGRAQIPELLESYVWKAPIDLCIFKGIVIYSFICDLKVVPIGWNIVVNGRLSCLMKAKASTK